VLVFRDISERQESERAIADLARFPSENPNPVLRISKEGEILHANPGSAPIIAAWGVGQGELAPPDWRAIVAAAIADCQEGVVESEIGDRVYHFSVAPLDAYANLYALDVTSRRRAEEAMHRYSERLHVLYETEQAILAARTAPEIAGVALRHLQELIPFQQASVTHFDLEAGAVSLLARYPGRAGESGGPEERRPLLSDELLAALAEGTVQIVEGAQEKAGGWDGVQALWLEGSAATVHVPLIVQDQLLGSLNLGLAAPDEWRNEDRAVALEIAAGLAIGIQQARLVDQVQRHAEELERQVRRRTAALQTSQARLQAIFEEAAIGIALVSRSGRIVDCNPALLHMLGYAHSELRGMVFSDLAHPDNARDDADLYQALVQGEREHYQVEGRYTRKDGSSIEANLTVSLVRPGRGRSSFAIALMEDVSDRKQAQAALVESEKLALTGRIAASLAHEINNPLQSVVGFLSLVQEQVGAGSGSDEYVTIALEEVERAADLVARLRNLNQPDQSSEPEPADVNALVERVLTLTRKRCQERYVEVEWTPGEELGPVPLRHNQIEQVVMNLVLNAVDAMPDGGRLQIAATHTDEPPGIEIYVCDSGVGMDEDALDHLFEPFFTTKDTGIGLGLYVSESIVKEHGGRIDVASVEGEGTSFTIWLPAA
jgi:PAS domain S-box-containing protein